MVIGSGTEHRENLEKAAPLWHSDLMRAITLLGNAVVVAVMLLLAANMGCSGSEDDDGSQATAANLGKGCLGGVGTDVCGAELVCSDEDAIGGPVCTRPCDTSRECPGNGACYIFDASDGHICARICQTDAECDALVPGLRCLDRSPSQNICAN
jgi:hypothetical protein